MSGINIENIVKSFEKNTVLTDITLKVESGDFVAVLGRSGSGKSTLLRIIAGLESADSGVIESLGALAMVFQEARLIPWLRVRDNLSIGNARSNDDISAALREVGLESRARDWPSTLSGGQAQRVSLARALVRTPEILLLDEPFGALDALTRLEMQDLVNRLHAHHKFTAVMVTHDVEEAVRLADRIIIIGEGRVVLDERVLGPPPRDPVDHPKIVKRLLSVLGVG